MRRGERDDDDDDDADADKGGLEKVFGWAQL
jgi:hypothetical protein